MFYVCNLPMSIQFCEYLIHLLCSFVSFCCCRNDEFEWNGKWKNSIENGSKVVKNLLMFFIYFTSTSLLKFTRRNRLWHQHISIDIFNFRFRHISRELEFPIETNDGNIIEFRMNRIDVFSRISMGIGHVIPIIFQFAYPALCKWS